MLGNSSYFLASDCNKESDIDKSEHQFPTRDGDDIRSSGLKAKGHSVLVCLE